MKTFVLTLLALISISLGPLGHAQRTIRQEAASASLSGPDMHIVRSGGDGADSHVKVYGGGYITGFQTDADQAEFTVRVKRSGVYALSLGYRSKGRKGIEFEINGLAMDVTLQPTSDDRFGEQGISRVELEAGPNKIILKKGWVWYDVNFLELKAVPPSSVVVAPASVPSDPQITPEAKELLDRLKSTYGKTTMLGGYGAADAAYVLQQTGRQPLIMGGDLLAYSPQEVAHGSHPERTDEVGRLISDAKAGQIITVSWHWCSPADLMDTPEKPWWRGFYTDSTNFDLQKTLANPGSPEYAAMLSDIDTIAVQLRRLQDAHVAVLWRPLHEAGGGWFWWGAKGPEPFVQLWQILFDRLTKTDGVHNLIWVFTGDGDLAWYPGDAYVDVVGIDAYPKDLRDPETALWDDLWKKMGDRKLLAISEFGGVPDIPRMQRLGEYWSYAVSWSGKEGPSKNSPEELKRIYNSSGVATLVPSADVGSDAQPGFPPPSR
jgi:mannan endo-1,4-beta-mannosidase